MADHPAPTAEARVRGGPLALAAVTLGLLTWPIAFNLGAYGEIFYTNIFQVVVASSILLVVAVVDDPTSSRWNWSIRVALAAPMVWLLAAGYVVGSTSEALDRPGFAVSLFVIVLCSVPITLRLLVNLSMPELSQAGSRKILMSIVTLVAVVAAIGFLVGREHPRFMTCSDFSVAGAAEPEGCAR